MEEAIIYQLPNEIFEHIFSYVRFEDFFGLFLSCKKTYTLSRNFELWRFWIKRDLLESYEGYLDKITNENKIIENAIEVMPKINPLFALINEALAELKVHTDQLNEILEGISDQYKYRLFMPESVYDMDGELDTLQNDLTSYCNDTAGDELTVDMLETDPIALYIQLATANDIVKCTNMVERRGRKIKIPCGKPSVPRKEFCQECIDANKNLIMKPTFSNLPGFPLCKPVEIPQLPVYHRPILQIKNFSPGKYVTMNTEPHFVIENINGGYCLLGVNDIGLEVRAPSYSEKEIAHGFGISISF
jgi:hypothetical protein